MNEHIEDELPIPTHEENADRVSEVPTKDRLPWFDVPIPEQDSSWMQVIAQGEGSRTSLSGQEGSLWGSHTLGNSLCPQSGSPQHPGARISQEGSQKDTTVRPVDMWEIINPELGRSRVKSQRLLGSVQCWHILIAEPNTLP